MELIRVLQRVSPGLCDRQRVPLRFRNTSIIFILVFCLLSGLAASVRSLDYRELHGSISTEVVGDSLVVEYDLRRNRFPLDSLLFALRDIDSGDTFSPTEVSSWHRLTPVTTDSADLRFGLEWAGRMQLFFKEDRKPNNYMLRLFKRSTDSLEVDTGRLVDDLCFVPTISIGREVNLGLAWFTKSGFPEPVHSSTYGVMGQLEDKLGIRGRRFAFYAGYSGNYSPRFVFFDLPRLEAEYAPWGWDGWQPRLHVAATYTRLNGFESPHEVKYKGYGQEVGLRVDGPFESLRYSYNTAVGGYHRADVVFAIAAKAAGTQKIGTIISYYRGEHVRMFAVTAYMEIWGSRNEQDGTLSYRNNRPWWHKGLALSGFLPFLPIALAMLGSS